MKVFLLLLAFFVILVSAGLCQGQQATVASSDSESEESSSAMAPESTADTQEPSQAASNSTLEKTIDAEQSSEPPQRKLTRWNEYQGPYFTGRWGAGLLLEVAGYSQDDNSKKQFALHPDQRLRDFRFILAGKLFPQWDRKITWSMGIMYDGPNHQWLMRQTGVMIAVPELWGNFFIGRSKEGFSLNKVMVGYDGWTMERATINDASIPILADGIKWLGYSPNHGFLWNVGYFNDVLSKGQSYSTYSSQEVVRLAWVPILNESDVLHLGVNLRFGKPVDDKLRLRSRPEAFPAPYFVDTGSFPSDSTRMLGYEAYYRPRRWLFGSEYWWVNVSSKTAHDPVFHGGDVVATYLFNDATRVYNTVGGYFRGVSPKRTVFEGGPGAWELVLRYSYIDLDSHTIRGGRLWRFTPMVNWHMSDNVRLEMGYGYGHLNRFDLRGNTQFFQSRIQLQF
jgi:phosphate-selective porin OprO/OprP